jgi:hypothetical protein
VSIGDKKVVDLLQGEKDLALAGSGELSIVEELAIDIMQPRVISVSATVVGRDDKNNTCVALGELAIVGSRSYGNSWQSKCTINRLESKTCTKFDAHQAANIFYKKPLV